MKHFLGKILLTIAAVTTGSALNTMASTTPLSASVLCYQSQGIAHWTYLPTRHSQSHQALVSIELEPGHNNQGQFTQSVIVKAVNGLYWDKNFENIYYKSPSRPNQPPVLCARKLWYGLQKNETDCNLRGEINPSSKIDPTLCGSEKTFLFKSVILVNND